MKKNKFRDFVIDNGVSICIGWFIIGVITLMIALPRAWSADVVYNANRGTTKRLKDMGDTTHAPVRFIGGEAMTEAAAVHFDTGVTADTFYILVDLSDTTNYPHSNTTGIDLKQMASSARQTADSFTLLVGVVTDIDGSGLTMSAVFESQVPTTLNTVSTILEYPFGGVDLEVSGTTVVGLKSADIAIPGITISTDLDSPAGTTNAEVGDLLLFVDEITDGGSLSWAMLTFYGSH